MKKITKILSIFWIFSFLLIQTAYGAELNDIGSNKNQTAIQYLYDNGVISGYPDGTFKPSNIVNRAELLKILVGGMGIQPTTNAGYKNCFPDVKEEWFAPFICYAKQYGWVSGYPDGTFQPAKTVNKVEAIKMLVNSQGYMIPSVVSGVVYNDVDNTAWYAPYVKAAKDKGLLEESSSTFGVTSNMTRANISENIYRAIIIGKESLTSFNEYQGIESSNGASEVSETESISEENASEFNITGYGTKATEKFTLKQGLVIVTSNYTGASNFISTLLDSDGNSVESITNEIGKFSGKTAFEIPTDGQYLMNVNSSGSWTFHFEQPTPSNTISEESYFSGKGTYVSDFFKVTQDSLVVFSFTHAGDSNFIADILNTDGTYETNVVNEIGITDGSKACYFKKGIYLLRVNADGNWSIKYENLNTKDVSTKTSFSGEGMAATPLFKLNSGLKIFDITHAGTSNFIVYLYDEEGNLIDLLANAIGDFTGSVAESIDGGNYILNIDADGDWTITIK
jgi:hypothetical protein